MRFLARLWAIIVKEALQLRRDPMTFAMMLIVPIVQLVLFGFAINTDPKGLPSALVALDHGRFTSAVVSALTNTDYYRFVTIAQSAEQADRLLESGEVAFVAFQQPLSETTELLRINSGQTANFLRLLLHFFGVVPRPR